MNENFYNSEVKADYGSSPLSALLKLSGNPAIGSYESLRLMQNSVDGSNSYWKDRKCLFSCNPYADILQ